MKTQKKKVKPKLTVIYALLALLVVSACGLSQTAAEKQQEYEELTDLVESRDFSIEHQWANPMQGNNINLIGNYNFIRFNGDSVEIHLPYFGTRHSGGGYGSPGGIDFAGQPENFTVKQDPEEREVYIRFKGSEDNEDLEFLITLFPSGKANTSVNSSQRSSISYQGEIQ